MDPISGMVEKKVADSVFHVIRKWCTRYGDLKKENQALKAQLDEKAAFERKLNELICRPQDDSIYFSRDGSGAAFCPLCINGSERLFTPLTHGINKGSYYCRLHEHYFDTEELRNRRSNVSRAPMKRFRGPHAWMSH